MNAQMILDILGIIWAILKSLFWRNSNIVYVNSNVKAANLKQIAEKLSLEKYKCVNCQSKKKNGLRALKRHFRKMRISLYQIQRNIVDSSKITYCGFASQMFSIYDGYILGNTFQYRFIDFNGKYYEFSPTIKDPVEQISLNGCNEEEVSLIISTSYDIDATKCLKNKQYVFYKKAPEKITSTYLNEVYAYVKNFLDACGKTNIKTVNLYITAKQSVSFIVGTAIQSYHPAVRIYEYRDNKFKYYLDLSKGKIFEVKE